MGTACPKCKSVFDAENVNVAENVAYCPRCATAYTLSTLASALAGDLHADTRDVPKGAWLHDDGVEFTVGATTRHFMALFIVPFMVVWSGFSIGGIYGTQIVNGKFDLSQSLFGIPFLLGTVVLGSVALMTVCGKIEVTIRAGAGRVFIGVGALGWTRRFDADAVTGVGIEQSAWRNQGQPAWQVVLDGPRRLRFGAGVSENRLRFIAAVLRDRLLNR
ncbi:MAG: hypothetical protein ACKVU4_04260 [Phycisphaerales bacterium]